MGNPFFLPDIPAQSPFRASTRRIGRIAPFLTLVMVGAWLALAFAAIILTLGDAMPGGKGHGAFIAELD